MNISNLLHQLGQKVKSNAPEILTGLGITGVISTAVLAARAGNKAAAKLSEQDPWMSNKEKAKIVWPLYIPTGISGVVTIGCIIGSGRASGKQTAAAVTAYSLTERAFSEYKEKVVEQIGKGKEQKVRDEIAQDRVRANPPSAEVIIVEGEVLCCELFTKRYFASTMERLQQAKNEINHRINNNMYVYLEEFYDLIDLPYTSNSGNLGWDSDKLMELEFSTVLSENNRPCLAFDYNYTKPL
jgi:hypothetical protein